MPATDLVDTTYGVVCAVNRQRWPATEAGVLCHCCFIAVMPDSDCLDAGNGRFLPAAQEADVGGIAGCGGVLAVLQEAG